MSRESTFTRQFCHVLDQGTYSLDRAVAERLRAARERALQRQYVPHVVPVIVGADGAALLSGTDEKHFLRTAMAILALLIGVGFTYYWNGFAQASEDEIIDSAMLADDLPPNAYLDTGFQAWLQEDLASRR